MSLPEVEERRAGWEGEPEAVAEGIEEAVAGGLCKEIWLFNVWYCILV